MTRLAPDPARAPTADRRGAGSRRTRRIRPTLIRYLPPLSCRPFKPDMCRTRLSRLNEFERGTRRTRGRRLDALGERPTFDKNDGVAAQRALDPTTVTNCFQPNKEQLHDSIRTRGSIRARRFSRLR